MELLIVQRILPDYDFISEAIEQAEPFIKLGILPELVRQWYTRHRQADSTLDKQSDRDKRTDTQEDGISRDDRDEVQVEGDDVQVNRYQRDGIQDTIINENDTNLDVTDDGQRCYCKKGESYDYMIGCDGDNCPIEWFHLSCLHLTLNQIPHGKWLYPECKTSSSRKQPKKLEVILLYSYKITSYDIKFMVILH